MAGASVIPGRTGITFTATSIGQADYALEGSVHELNVAGARIAREAAGDRFVAGSVGPLNAVSETRQTPMPSALAVIPAFIALTIWLMSDVCDPVHWYVHPKTEHASWMP